ncbi:hypothetical protein FEP58_05702 [Burkholderia multivorans]|nr:hypothetical protein [Burkholderia multivorans]
MRRDERGAHGQRAAVETAPRIGIGPGVGPFVQRRAREGRRVVRIRNRVAMRGIGERRKRGEFAAAALAYGVGERAAIVGEELERLRAAVFFAHEQQRDLRRQQQQRGQRAQRVVVRERAQPLAERAIADLVVVLQERHERGRRQLRARLAARCAVVQRRRFALVRESFAERAREMTQRRVRIRAVVAVALAGQQHVRAVVEVVVPLRVEAVRPEQARGIAFVLEHQMHVALACGRAHAPRELAQPRVVVDRVRRVDA